MNKKKIASALLAVSVITGGVVLPNMVDTTSAYAATVSANDAVAKAVATSLGKSVNDLTDADYAKVVELNTNGVVTNTILKCKNLKSVTMNNCTGTNLDLSSLTNLNSVAVVGNNYVGNGGFNITAPQAEVSAENIGLTEMPNLKGKVMYFSGNGIIKAPSFDKNKVFLYDQTVKTPGVLCVYHDKESGAPKYYIDANKISLPFVFTNNGKQLKQVGHYIELEPNRTFNIKTSIPDVVYSFTANPTELSVKPSGSAEVKPDTKPDTKPVKPDTKPSDTTGDKGETGSTGTDKPVSGNNGSETKPNGGLDNSTSVTKPSTGDKTETVTKPNGDKVQVSKDKDGSTVETVTKPNGEKVVTVKNKEGKVVSTKVEPTTTTSSKKVETVKVEDKKDQPKAEVKSETKLPSTGFGLGYGLIGAVTAGIGALGLRKRK